MKHDTISLSGDFDDALITVTEALAAEGFGVITRIDMDLTFKAKLDVEFPRYVILGACNPQLAHTAVSAAPEIGLLLPCNVTVSQEAENIVVRIPDAKEMLGGAGLSDAPELANLAQDAGARLDRVVTALKTQA